MRQGAGDRALFLHTGGPVCCPYGSTRTYLIPGRVGLGPAPTTYLEVIYFYCRGRSQTGLREGQAPPLRLSRKSSEIG